jgi:rhodanese-related sulfurtransferase
MDRTDDAVDATDPLEIAPGELRSLVEGDAPEGLRLVDVRPPRQYARGHLPGSENVPLGRLTDRAEDLDGAERVVCVCQEGIASLQAARLLAAYEGVERAESLAGGIDEWPGELATGGERSERGDDAAPF